MHLTHREFELLRYLAERQERVVHRDELLREVWGYPDVPTHAVGGSRDCAAAQEDRADPHHPQFIHTVHGDGYCLTPQGRAAADGTAGPDTSPNS